MPEVARLNDEPEKYVGWPVAAQDERAKLTALPVASDCTLTVLLATAAVTGQGPLALTASRKAVATLARVLPFA
jgi:hypothetical protein